MRLCCVFVGRAGRRLGLVVAVLVERIDAADDLVAFSTRFADQERTARAALRADDRRIPRDEVALRPVVAAVEQLAAFASTLLDDHAAVDRTDDARIDDDVLRRLARRIAGARDELAVAAVLEDERF